VGGPQKSHTAFPIEVFIEHAMAAIEQEFEEHTMKMDSSLVDRTLSQIKAEAIPEDHPALPKLKDLFGDHTFFLDPSGLNIVEPMEEQPQTGIVVNVASWDDEDPPHLLAHSPESTNVRIEFGPMH
jgi:hypothetical protein